MNRFSTGLWWDIGRCLGFFLFSYFGRLLSFSYPHLDPDLVLSCEFFLLLCSWEPPSPLSTREYFNMAESIRGSGHA
ncbi:hypothetical protein BCR44DRAFT_1426461 [Catenaria anguillulae PL171]|uniref:Uncharacterized protein n=1 Tax=Catenaria anguillulae PL171 TaxID=765915 RepID=A0A1Y2HXW6_9FUNG|nr:hypothetical protein BCR44DRAFT_1426461 [Catenaria anguillulae PL171]